MAHLDRRSAQSQHQQQGCAFVSHLMSVEGKTNVHWTDSGWWWCCYKVELQKCFWRRKGRKIGTWAHKWHPLCHTLIM